MKTLKLSIYIFLIRLSICILGSFFAFELIRLIDGYTQSDELFIAVIELSTISFFYIVSGYAFHKFIDRNTPLIILFSPFLFGLLFWLLCLIVSPQGLDWELESPEIWVFYVIYVADYYAQLSYLLSKIEIFNTRHSISLIASLYSAIPSLFMVVGLLIGRTSSVKS